MFFFFFVFFFFFLGGGGGGARGGGWVLKQIVGRLRLGRLQVQGPKTRNTKTNKKNTLSLNPKPWQKKVLRYCRSLDITRTGFWGFLSYDSKGTIRQYSS